MAVGVEAEVVAAGVAVAAAAAVAAGVVLAFAIRVRTLPLAAAAVAAEDIAAVPTDGETEAVFEAEGLDEGDPAAAAAAAAVMSAISMAVGEAAELEPPGDTLPQRHAVLLVNGFLDRGERRVRPAHPASISQTSRPSRQPPAMNPFGRFAPCREMPKRVQASPCSPSAAFSFDPIPPFHHHLRSPERGCSIHRWLLHLHPPIGPTHHYEHPPSVSAGSRSPLHLRRPDAHPVPNR